jgi:hypothetical protein
VIVNKGTCPSFSTFMNSTLFISPPPKKEAIDQTESIYKRLQLLQIFEVDPKPRYRPVVKLDQSLFITPKKSIEKLQVKGKEITDPVLVYTTCRLDTVPLAVIQEDLQQCGRLVPQQKSLWKKISMHFM